MGLADQLSALAEQGREITFAGLGMPADAVRAEMSTVAAGPYAPLLAEAVTHAFDHAEVDWHDIAGTFPGGFAHQSSFLHTTATLETLLASTPATQQLAKALNTALLNDFNAVKGTQPLLAAARLEGAVRLAVAKSVNPYQVWGILEELEQSDTPEDLTERLPRIIGLGLDSWSSHEQAITATLRSYLERLSHDEASDIDAFVELGYDRLRTALTSRTVADVIDHLQAAHTWFTTADAAEEARHDARAYAAVCDALLAFTAGQHNRLNEAADRLAATLNQRHAWTWGMHQPAWLQPQKAAEVAWEHLVLQLKHAAEHLQDAVWMEPWGALDHVLTAYQAARTVCPVGSAEQGMSLLVEPAIEDTFLRQQSLLAQLRRAVTEPDTHPTTGFDQETALKLLTRVEQQLTARPSGRREHGSTAGADAEEPPGEAETERAHRLAPAAVKALGRDFTARLARTSTDDDLKAIDDLAYHADLTRLQNSDPVVVPLLNRLLHGLEAFPDFVGETRRTFTVLVGQTVHFLRAAADLDTATAFGEGRTGPDGKRIKFRDYRRRFDKANGDLVPVEGDLQHHFYIWLLSSQIGHLVQVEAVNRALGRADILVHFGSRQYLTEIKKNHTSNDRAYLEKRYLAQAAEYTNTTAPFGQLLVLDLTEKKKAGTLRVDELTWLAKHRPPEALIDRAVVAAVVTGNRYTPSDFSA
ncbi:hypothetical protein [Streptomyces sp. NRRL S-241]|uniref:hypothetical protein n=1 Tax=Streptomyces sp. NRRL S-241 TaxID=1463896 RepID=UPI0004C1B450|nr:hypothetical protein [Streptomyces sp. NRRL S-241]